MPARCFLDPEMDAGWGFMCELQTGFNTVLACLFLCKHGFPSCGFPCWVYLFHLVVAVGPNGAGTARVCILTELLHAKDWSFSILAQALLRAPRY